ncbi:6-bladed beta-propeller [Algoriphagus sp.]|uniref:6-bladed beta-propeller n=1 Tax=Algoriphagus sp. TaxID=1872435 RepID=UPI0039194555
MANKETFPKWSDYLAIICLISLGSCSNAKEISSEKELFEEKISQIIDLTDVKSGYFSDLFDSVRYVLLQEDKEIPLVHQFKTIFQDDFIYVSDIHLNNLHKYDLNGNLITILKSNGQGPKEFSQIEDFQIVGDTIIIYDGNLGKLIYFNQNLEFIKEIKHNFSSTNFYRGKNFNLFSLNNVTNSQEVKFVKIYDNKNPPQYFTATNQNALGRVRLLHGFVKNSNSTEVSITLPFSHNIALFKEDGNLKVIKEFTFNIDEVEEIRGQIKIINAFIPFGEFYFITVFFGKNGFQILLDQNSETKYIGKNLINDLDGLNYYFLPISFYKDFLILYFPSIDIYNLYKSSEEKIKENHPYSNLHNFVNENEKELIGDRHVLVFLKLKDQLPN